jgi:hypothetical protein
MEYYLTDLDKNSSPLLSIFSVRDDYRMNDPARKAVLLAPTKRRIVSLIDT